uniref:Cytochrome P450 n=1 Tax=Timema monikensis TaxID=170555 RepID=A0A7R9EFY7_9NEOP|nr:unnamed protein product [Timema monikensis]
MSKRYLVHRANLQCIVPCSLDYVQKRHRPYALSSASIKPILWDGGREGERHGVASQPTNVSFRANKNRWWITETVDDAIYWTGVKWHFCRKLLTPAFHFKILEEFIPIFNKNSSIFVEKLSEYVDKDCVPINKLVSLCTLDIICETAMGTCIHAQTSSENEYPNIFIGQTNNHVPVHDHYSPLEYGHKIRLFLLCVMSILLYSAPVFSYLPRYRYNHLRAVYNRFLHLILGAPPRVPNRVLLTISGLPSLDKPYPRAGGEVFQSGAGQLQYDRNGHRRLRRSRPSLPPNKGRPSLTLAGDLGVESGESVGELMFHRILSPWLWRPFTLFLSPTGWEQRKTLRTLHGFTEKVIKERRAEYKEAAKKHGSFPDQLNNTNKKRLTFLDLLIEVSEQEGILSNKEIREEVDTFMFEPCPDLLPVDLIFQDSLREGLACGQGNCVGSK